jgi:hypothetical protein
VTSVDDREYLDMISESFARQGDNALLGARRILNSELRYRGYVTDQDSAVSGIVVGGAYAIGYLCGLASIVAWWVS